MRVLALSGALALAACGGGGGGDDGGGQGTLKVSMTDAPACGFNNVFVTVNKVRVHSSASAEANAGAGSISMSCPRARSTCCR